jgi:hypothetical protein
VCEPVLAGHRDGFTRDEPAAGGELVEQRLGKAVCEQLDPGHQGERCEGVGEPAGEPAVGNSGQAVVISCAS